MEFLNPSIEIMVREPLKNQKIIQKMTKRDIAGYMGTLKDHTECTDIKVLYNLYKTEFNDVKRKDEFVGSTTVY